MRVSIRQRVGVGLLVLMLLLVLLIVITARTVTTYRQNTLLLSQKVIPQIQLLSDLKATLATVQVESLDFILTNNQDNEVGHQEAAARSRTLLAQLNQTITTGDENYVAHLDAFNNLTTTIDRLLTLTEKTLREYQQGQRANIILLASQVNQTGDEAAGAVNILEQLLQQDNAAVFARTQTNPLSLISIIALGLAFVLIAFFIIVGHTVIRPLTILREANLAVAAGDRSRQVSITSGDELGDLARAFNTMVQQVGEQEQLLAAQVDEAILARREAETAQTKIVAQLATIATQREVIRDISVPILPLSDAALVIPLVGTLDPNRLVVLQERALHAINRSAARYVILDITGVLLIDTQSAQGLMDVVVAARLLGSQVLMVGVRPEVAQALVELNIDFRQVTTRATLQSGIAYVLNHS